MYLLSLDVNFQIRIFMNQLLNFIAVPTDSYKDPGNAGIKVLASPMHSLQIVLQEWPLFLFPKRWCCRRYVLALGRKRTFADQMILEKVICGIQ